MGLLRTRPSGPRIVVGAGVRVRRDRVDKQWRLTLRHRTKLHHIGMGAAHRGRGVIMLVHDLDVRVISEDSELLRHFTLDPSREYQPQRIVSSVYDAPTHPATMRRHITAFRGEGLGNHLTRGTNLNVQVVDRVL